LQAQLDRIADVLGAREHYDSLEPAERTMVIAFSRSYLRQALDLVEDPTREHGWSYADPALLQAQGSASSAVARLFAAAGLGAPGMRILDVGTGVAGLAIAFCETYPDSTVVGVDPWEPSLEIARKNVADAGLEARITLVQTTIQELEDAHGFDLAWLPSFFIPEAVLDEALGRIRELLRHGGQLVVGTRQGEADSLDAVIDDLRTIRSGGSAVGPEEVRDSLEQAGFTDVHEPDLGPDVPLRLAVGTRP
jgi:cyclopropane fatty-acyl-phospholipid synthase-like methyltransferase